MTAFQAFGCGWADVRRSKTALAMMWVTYALIAKIVAIPALLFLLAPLSHSRMAEKLAARFDPVWLGDLIGVANTATTPLIASGVLALALTWLAAIFFAGGVLTMLDEHWDRFSYGLFFSGAGENFWRILRLSLFGVVCYGLVYLIARLPSIVANKIYGEGMEEWPIGVARIVSSILMVLLFGWVATALDYAKVRLVAGLKRGAFKALLYAFALVFRQFRRTMGVWLLNALLFALVSFVYLQLSGLLSSSAAAAVAGLIVLQQIFVLVRTAQRVALWGAALSIYDWLRLPAMELDTALESAMAAGAPATPAPEVEKPVEPDTAQPE